MADVKKRSVEVYTAGCPCCDAALKLVREIACEDCEVTAHDMRDPAVAKAAETLGIRVVPAVVIDGELAGCCTSQGPTEESLRAAGLGRAA